MKKGDCFLYHTEKSGHLYYITNVYDDKIEALSIAISRHTVDAWDCPEEYDNDIPEGIKMIPSSVYHSIVGCIKVCADDMHKIIHEEALREDFEIEIGALYSDGCDIYRIKELKDDRWHSKLFRIREESISYNFKSDCCADSYFKNSILPITEDTLSKIMNRFDELLLSIKNLINLFLCQS